MRITSLLAWRFAVDEKKRGMSDKWYAADFDDSTASRCAVAEGSAGMTGANRLPAQQTTRGLRCQSAPTPAEAARSGIQTAFLAMSRPLEPVPEVNPPLELGIRGGGVILVLKRPGGGAGQGSNGKKAIDIVRGRTTHARR